jgi:hypothetical protein
MNVVAVPRKLGTQVEYKGEERVRQIAQAYSLSLSLFPQLSLSLSPVTVPLLLSLSSLWWLTPTFLGG